MRRFWIADPRATIMSAQEINKGVLSLVKIFKTAITLMRRYGFIHFLKKKHGYYFFPIWGQKGSRMCTLSIKGFPTFIFSSFSIGHVESRDSVGSIPLQVYMKD